VIGPELGVTQPGMTIVCGDSHTSTHGAFGALAFGIGTSEVNTCSRPKRSRNKRLSRWPSARGERATGRLGQGHRARHRSTSAPVAAPATSSSIGVMRFATSRWKDG